MGGAAPCGPFGALFTANAWWLRHPPGGRVATALSFAKTKLLGGRPTGGENDSVTP